MKQPTVDGLIKEGCIEIHNYVSAFSFKRMRMVRKRADKHLTIIKTFKNEYFLFHDDGSVFFTDFNGKTREI